MAQNNVKKRLLTGSNTNDEFSINKSRNIDIKRHGSLQQNNNANKKSKCACCVLSWKCACLSTTLTTALITIITSILLFTVIFPNVAQNTIDNVTMDIIDGTIYNPTNTSITMNTSIAINNVGMFSGSIPSTTVTVYHENIKIGRMKMPSIETTANTPSIITLVTVLHIENKTEFQNSCKQLLQNIDQIWTISASNIKIKVHTGFIGTFGFTINLNKDLILAGAHLYDFVASDFNVNTATPSSVTAISNLTFSVDSILKLSLPPTCLQVYINGTYIGYAPMTNGVTMKNGRNTLLNQSLIIESDLSNQSQRDVISHFFSEYIMNHNQNVSLRGPIARKGYQPLVIDGVLDSTALALGYSLGTLAFGGVVTSQSQLGWKVGKHGPDVRGAYANMLNPLNVPLRIHNLSANTWLHMYLQYDVTLALVATYKCANTSQYAHLGIGAGIVKDNATITWVDIAASAWTSFFTIAEPFVGSGEARNSSSNGCMGIMPFSCCFATMTTAYVCALNPGLKGEDELQNAFMPLSLHSNITAEVDYPNGFMVNITYDEPFFPTYFGYQIYAGYIGDAWLDCGCYKYKSDVNQSRKAIRKLI